MVEEAYTQQGRAQSRRLHPDWAARPALMSRAANAVESKAVVRIEVAVSPRPLSTLDSLLPSQIARLARYFHTRPPVVVLPEPAVLNRS